MCRCAGQPFFLLDSENDEIGLPQVSEFKNPVRGISAFNEEFRFAPGLRFLGHQFAQETLRRLADIMSGNEIARLWFWNDVQEDEPGLKFLRERDGVGSGGWRRGGEISRVEDFADFPIRAAGRVGARPDGEYWAGHGPENLFGDGTHQ